MDPKNYTLCENLQIPSFYSTSMGARPTQKIRNKKFQTFYLAPQNGQNGF